LLKKTFSDHPGKSNCPKKTFQTVRKNQIAQKKNLNPSGGKHLYKKRISDCQLKIFTDEKNSTVSSANLECGILFIEKISFLIIH
jgi:hypothetical protein